MPLSRLILSLSICCLLLTCAVAAWSQGTARAGRGQDQAREFNQRGIVLQGQGKLTEAAEEYRKAIKVYPAGPAGHNNLAIVLKEMNQLPAAELEARTAIKL